MFGFVPNKDIIIKAFTQRRTPATPSDTRASFGRFATRLVPPDWRTFWLIFPQIVSQIAKRLKIAPEGVALVCS